VDIFGSYQSKRRGHHQLIVNWEYYKISSNKNLQHHSIMKRKFINKNLHQHNILKGKLINKSLHHSTALEETQQQQELTSSQYSAAEFMDEFPLQCPNPKSS
jgi:hypothetical protein